MVTSCNGDDDLEKIAEADWVLEAVVERLDIKELISKTSASFKARNDSHTNTSGIPLNDLTASLPEDVKTAIYDHTFF